MKSIEDVGPSKLINKMLSTSKSLSSSRHSLSSSRPGAGAVEAKAGSKQNANSQFEWLLLSSTHTPIQKSYGSRVHSPMTVDSESIADSALSISLVILTVMSYYYYYYYYSINKLKTIKSYLFL